MDFAVGINFQWGCVGVLFTKGYKFIRTYLRRNFGGPIFHGTIKTNPGDYTPKPQRLFVGGQTGKTQKEGLGMFRVAKKITWYLRHTCAVETRYES